MHALFATRAARFVRASFFASVHASWLLPG
ncbi:hypothetical protein M218_10120 [Burkholderia pseudomallei MSHR338]|nr:hypothetical protein M218_10120 [Burkholderia pseudomallei MSHR338]